MMKINKYIFLEITKGSLLVFFIFISISWLLQFTRLISLTDLIQVDILTILYLSLFLIPNLATIILPFVIIFGLIISFVKLYKDRELISFYSLGLSNTVITKPLILFSLIVLTISIIFNFYISPKIYKEYKLKEHEIRNNINFEKIIISNFIEINKNTFLDFKKDNSNFREVFIKFNENNENLIYAKEADIKQNEDKFIFRLTDGFKITLIENKKIEKLEFDNYTLEIENSSFNEYDNFDNNTFDFIEDIYNNNYINILYKTIDSFLVIFIIIFFYLNNIREYKFNINSLLFFTCFSSILLIINQVLKNTEFNLNFYLLFISILLSLIFIFIFIRKKNV